VRPHIKKIQESYIFTSSLSFRTKSDDDDGFFGGGGVGAQFMYLCFMAAFVN
jgi:hypothetical protein